MSDTNTITLPDGSEMERRLTKIATRTTASTLLKLCPVLFDNANQVVSATEVVQLLLPAFEGSTTDPAIQADEAIVIVFSLVDDRDMQVEISHALQEALRVRQV